MLFKIMKNLHNSKEQKDTYKSLKRIEKLISNSATREQGSKLLSTLDSTTLCPKDQLNYYFLQARYYVKCYREHKDVEFLEWANDFMDDLITSAYNHNIKVRDNRYHFTRAYVKFQLARLVWDDDRKPWLMQKAKSITCKALEFHPNNSSFNWLQAQF